MLGLRSLVFAALLLGLLWFKSKLSIIVKLTFTIISIICFSFQLWIPLWIVNAIISAFIIWEKCDREHSL